MAFNIYEWRRNQLLLEEVMNENKTKVSDITFSKDVSYPDSIAMGSSMKIKSEEEFEKWKKKFINQYGDIELEKGAAGWKALPGHEANKQAQADADKYAKRK